MATYYAQAAGAIQSIEWDTSPTGGGTDLVWGTLQPADVLVANGNAITWSGANVPTLTCARITTAAEGGTAGGGFTLSGTVSMTADTVAGTSTCCTCSNNTTLTVTGDITGGTGTAIHGLFTGNGTTLTVTGDITGGTGTACYGVSAGASAIVIVYGDVTGGGNAAYGINAASSTITIYGTVTGGSTGTSYGVLAHLFGKCRITGSLINGTRASAVAGPIWWTPASVAHYWQVAWNGSYNFRYTLPPLAQNVREGVQRGYMLEFPDYGTLQIPAEADVKAGVGYGGSGTEYTGTLVAGGGGVPLIGPGGLVG